MSTEPMASEATQQNEQNVGGGGNAFSEQGGGPGAQNEQNVGRGGNAFSEQGGHGGGSYEPPRATPVFHGTTPQPESGTHDDLSTGMHGGEPTNFATGGGAETGYGTHVSEEPTHVYSQEPTHVYDEQPSLEDSGHAAAQDASGDAGHYGGADAGQELHHG